MSAAVALHMPDESWAVGDSEQAGVGYRVIEMFPGEFGCSCGAFTFLGRGYACAHIRAVIAFREHDSADCQIGASR